MFPIKKYNLSVKLLPALFCILITSLNGAVPPPPVYDAPVSVEHHILNCIRTGNCPALNALFADNPILACRPLSHGEPCHSSFCACRGIPDGAPRPCRQDTPLWYAAALGQNTVITLLIPYYTSKEKTGRLSSLSFSPLFIAAGCGHADTVVLLAPILEHIASPGHYLPMILISMAIAYSYSNLPGQKENYLRILQRLGQLANPAMIFATTADADRYLSKSSLSPRQRAGAPTLFQIMLEGVRKGLSEHR